MGWQQGDFVTAVLLGFGGVALLLASFGLSSVACYSIAHRTREFGIRASPSARRLASCCVRPCSRSRLLLRPAWSSA
jgi:hypothetical protein